MNNNNNNNNYYFFQMCKVTKHKELILYRVEKFKNLFEQLRH